MIQNSCLEMQNLIKLYQIHDRLTVSKPTFMQLSGYPHFENVCSNILQFYLNPSNCHGLRTLLLSALLNLVGKDSSDQYLQDVRIERESLTSKNYRIDLLIITNRYIIGIENKIYSGVQNDLNDYSLSIEDFARTEGKEAIRVLLSIRNEISTIPQSSKFVTESPTNIE